ncbi:thiosulfate:glutathione sulfurtransferase isoform X1 [Oncorhynchus kisutch]|uniref:Thiosulfate:glutathione sulfurtransferase n=1 Tax=Oncorhynchus kisutch TaxID=8019 RepID=A0A8C7DRX1_ONCKI|nr:thiosulfate:glutathione sulfurtransferase isoform X1 [Oncorhynchus kisutch]
MVNMVSGLLLRRIFLTVAETSSHVSLGMRGQWCGFTTSTTRFSESSLPNPDSVVSYKQLKNMLSTHNVQLFDVRNPDEFMAGRIPDSVNIPLSQLEESLKLSPEHFQLQFEVKAPGKDDDNLVFHCQKGRRSAEALAIARQLGFNRARHYQGGYSEWAAHEGK